MRPYNSMEKGKKEEPTLSHLALCLVFLFFAEAEAQTPVNLDALVLLDAAVGSEVVTSTSTLLKDLSTKAISVRELLSSPLADEGGCAKMDFYVFW